MRDGREGAANTGSILVAQNSQNNGRALIPELFAPGLRQDACARRVVSAVDDDALIPSLKTRGPVNIRQTTSDRFFADCDAAGAQRRDGERSILPLMRSGQRDGSFHIRLAHDLECRLTFGRARAQHFFGLGFLRRRNDRERAV